MTSSGAYKDDDENNVKHYSDRLSNLIGYESKLPTYFMTFRLHVVGVEARSKSCAST